MEVGNKEKPLHFGSPEAVGPKVRSGALELLNFVVDRVLCFPIIRPSLML